MNNIPPAITAFRTLFESGTGVFDLELLDSDAELRPPTYGKSWHGRLLVGRLLKFAANALGGLRYTEIWARDGQFVLRFEGEIAGQPISGVDIVTLSGTQIATIEIFARPPKAVLALRDAMGKRVTSDPEISSAMGLAQK